MTGMQETGGLDGIEAEARNVPTLRYALLMLALALGPLGITMLVMAVGEQVSGLVTDKSYKLAAAVALAGNLIGLGVAAVWWVRCMSRGQTAKNSAQAAPLEAFQIGLRTINELWRPWWTAVVGFAAAAYVIFRTWGGRWRIQRAVLGSIA